MSHGRNRRSDFDSNPDHVTV